MAKTKETILSVHAPLKEVWGRGYGYRLMLVESEVLLDILQGLAARRIPALGLHDGLLVAVSDKEAMRRVAKAVHRDRPARLREVNLGMGRNLSPAPSEGPAWPLLR